LTPTNSICIEVFVSTPDVVNAKPVQRTRNGRGSAAWEDQSVWTTPPIAGESKCFQSS
jgi:hypothetical protein